MARIPIDPTELLRETIAALADPGCLLVSKGSDGTPNVMTIGWATFGVIWGLPICTVYVRHSRHTWKLLEQHGEFTVNVPAADLAQAAVTCGTLSGRDADKFAEAGLTPVPAAQVDVPIIDECVLHYECSVVHRTNVDPMHLAGSVLDGCYSKGDFHAIYHGHILGAQAHENARARLGG